MANSELYRPVNSIQVEGFTHSEIQGVTVPSKRIPFKEGHIPQFSCVAVGNKDENESNAGSLRQISSHHGRSYEFPMGEEGPIIFSDEYDNIYTSLTTKGNNLTASLPLITKEGNAPSGFRLHGLQDSDSMVRALRASELLRSHGIPTELFVKVIEPLQLPYKEEVISLDEFKKRLVQQVWEENANPDDESEKLTRRDIPKLASALDNMTFFITIRAMQVPERINDFLHIGGEEDIKKIAIRAFRYINLEEQKKAQKDSTYTPQLLPIPTNGAELIGYYIGYCTYVLPRIAAENIGKMHKLGLVHKYPHIANISTVGSIYDLDSVQGELLGLGDPPVTREDTIKDAMEFIYGHANWPLPSEVAHLPLVENGEDIFRDKFIDTYAREMGYFGNIEHFGDVAKLYKDFDDRENLDALSLYLREVFEQQNIDFECITPQEVAEFIVAKIPVSGETMRRFEEGDSSADDARWQAALAASISCEAVGEELKEHLSERGLDKKVTKEQLETFIDYFWHNSITKINEEIFEIWNQAPEGGDEDLFKKKRAEEYNNKPKSEKVKWLEEEFFRSLIWEWRWEEDVNGNLDKIKKLYEDNGIKFEGEVADHYVKTEV